MAQACPHGTGCYVVTRSNEVVHFQGLRRDEGLAGSYGNVQLVVQQLHGLANKGWEAPKPRLGMVTQWRTATGQIILVADMEDGHLLNAERYIRKNMETSRLYGRRVAPSSEYEAMLDEIKHRGLEPLEKREHPLKGQIEARIQQLGELMGQAYGRRDYQAAKDLGEEAVRLHRQLSEL
jgi:hypothetical protein